MTVKNVSLKVLVEAAYGVQGSRVVGGPGWVSSDRFDIEAKGTAGASKPQVWLMLRSLLADRFKVILRNEVRELPLYSLELGKKADRSFRSWPTRIARTFQCPCRRMAPLLFHAEPSSGLGDPRGVFWEAGRCPFPESPMVCREPWNVPWSIRPGSPELITSTCSGRRKVTSQGRAGKAKAGSQSRRSSLGLPSSRRYKSSWGLRLVARKGAAQILVIDHAERPSGN